MTFFRNLSQSLYWLRSGLLLLALAACADSSSPDEERAEKAENTANANSIHVNQAFVPLNVTNGWVRASIPGAAVTAAYMRLENTSNQTREITGVEAQYFMSAEIHEMSSKNGMMQMRELNQLVIPAAQAVELKPGGLHLMLMQPEKNLQAGDSVELTLVFVSGDRQVLSLMVK